MDYKKVKVSIVIPVKNGALTINRCLSSLVKQTYKNIEIVVVDNFSSDRTPNIVKNFQERDNRINFYQKGPERSAQMNYGVKKAKGLYIFVTSCDMVVDKNFVELAVEKCLIEGFDVVNGHIKSETKGFWSRVKGMERLMYVNDPLMETALFYPKKIFLELGGFDEKMVGVEEDLQHKIDEHGYKLGIIDSYQTHIDEIDSLREIVLKSFYYGLYDAAYFKKRPLKAFQKRFPIRRAFIRNFAEFIKQPDLFIGFIVFKVIQYTTGLAGLVLALIFSLKKENVQKALYEN